MTKHHSVDTNKMITPNVNKHPTKVTKQRADVKKHYILAPKDFAGQAKAGLSMKMYCKAMGIPIVKANRQSEWWEEEFDTLFGCIENVDKYNAYDPLKNFIKYLLASYRQKLLQEFKEKYGK